MYKINDQVVPRHSFFENIPQLEDECKKCWKYFLNPRNKSVKSLDVQMGKNFEEKLGLFFEKKNFIFKKGDNKNKKYPDNAICSLNGDILAYYEVKYHQAPFVKAYNFNPGRECYEGSVTLDYAKVKKQLEIIKNEIDVPVYYVHWIDFPCIKGIFYQSAADTELFLNKGIEYDRKEREGDFRNNKKVGYTKKFYPSLYSMKTFEDLCMELSNLRDLNDSNK
ncbi:hypothetical protein [Methanolobus psychrotolerans]|uniref:hypothetical protein n=1 Tax=Methanolobus psychrotolerans TaxID=1874706 RepID=UPI00101ADCB1|nr:hypothetical protein [Methanolobus psychrotolerans]